MTDSPDRAIVYCDKASQTSNGKTAHGLVRFTRRYSVLGVVDSECAGQDAGLVLDGRSRGIPILPTIEEAVAFFNDSTPATHLVVGLAPDGGRLPAEARRDIRKGLQLGLNVDSGLHDFLSEDPKLAAAARRRGMTIRDVRKPPARHALHFFSGKIEEVSSLKVVLLGTDSAVGKRTTAWLLVQALAEAGHSAELVGTGQTAWMQGARYGVILDSLVNDFVSGEIEHAVWSCWSEQEPDVIVIEGQGSLLNPAYPGGFEILAAGRPDLIVLQHAPARREYDGFPGYPIHPLQTQIDALELISGKSVVAITVNHEDLSPDRIPQVCAEIRQQTGRPAYDVLASGGAELGRLISGKIRNDS